MTSTPDDNTEIPSGRESPEFEGAIDPKEWGGTKPYRASTRGCFAPIAVQTDWRQKMEAAFIKFDDVAKGRWLAEFERSGRKSFAAAAAGVTMETVQRHIKNDPNFAAMVGEADQKYRDRLCGKIIHEAIEGTLVTKSRLVKSDDGETFEEEVHREVKFESGIRDRILRSLDPAFKDAKDVNLTGNLGGGGVLIVPAVANYAEWEALFGPDAPKAADETGETDDSETS